MTSESAIRVHLDEQLCCGHGRCYALCPEVFEEDEAGHAVLVAEVVRAGLEDRVRAAARNCPELAITLDDGAGAQEPQPG